MIPYKTATDAVERLINPLNMKSPTSWPREMKIFKRITAEGRYDDGQFWAEINFPQYYSSMAYFIKGDGAKLLEERWRYHQYLKSQSAPQESLEQSQNSLDIDAQSQILEDGKSESAHVVRKKTMLEWVDSKN